MRNKLIQIHTSHSLEETIQKLKSITDRKRLFRPMFWEIYNEKIVFEGTYTDHDFQIQTIDRMPYRLKGTIYPTTYGNTLITLKPVTTFTEIISTVFFFLIRIYPFGCNFPFVKITCSGA